MRFRGPIVVARRRLPLYDLTVGLSRTGCVVAFVRPHTPLGRVLSVGQVNTTADRLARATIGRRLQHLTIR